MVSTTLKNDPKTTTCTTQLVCQVCGGAAYQTRGQSRCPRCGFVMCVGCEMSEVDIPEQDTSEIE